MPPNFPCRAGLAAMAALLCSCRETTPSDYVRTSRVAAVMEATAESDTRVTVRAELHVGSADSGTYVVLHTGDELRATAGKDTKTMQSVGEGVYEADLKATAEVDIQVGFDRDKHEDAPGSVVTLPPPFSLVLPEPGEELSRAEDALLITWTPAGDVEGRAELSGSCIKPASIAVSGGDGELLIEPGELTTDPADADDTCDVDVVVTFTRRGAPDPALHEDSTFVARQTRRGTFLSVP